MKPYKSVLATVLSLRWNQIKLRLRGLRFRERADKDLSDDERARFDIELAGGGSVSASSTRCAATT